MKKGFNLLVVLVVLSVFVAGLLLAGCGNKAGQAPAPAPEKQAPKEEPASAKQAAKEEPAKQVTKEAPAKAATPKRGGTLIIGVAKEITNMNPQVNTQSLDKTMRTLMYETFLQTNKAGDLKPGLAERWEISPDGKVYTFYLRKDVKFHNGKPMTARDVKFTIDYVMDPKNGARGQSTFRVVTSVEVVDNYTIKLTIKDPFSPFISQLADIQSFGLVPEGSLETGVEKPTSYPPGTGPFKFVEYKPGQHIIVERNDDYWGHVPYLDRLNIKMPIPDDDVRFMALRAGDLDLVQRVPLTYSKKILDGEIKGLGYVESAVGAFRGMVFNVQAPPFDNLKLRQAVAYALDKKDILQTAFWGYGTVANEKVPVGSEWHLGNPSIKRDVNKAKELLKEAGYPDGLDVKLMDRKGSETLNQVIQQQLNEVGFRVTLDLVEASVESLKRRNGDYTFASRGLGGQLNDPYSALAPDFMSVKSEQRASNYSGYSNTEMDTVLTKLGIETDFNKRKDLYRQAMEIVWRDLPEIYIGYPPAIWAFKDKIKGFSASDAEDWVFEGGGLAYTWIE